MALTARKKLSIALAAIAMYEDEAAQTAASVREQAVVAPALGAASPWVLAGRQEAMLMRTMLQRRISSPVGLR